jgi:hypothetical protein
MELLSTMTFQSQGRKTMRTQIDIHQFQGMLGKRLIRWGGLSIGLGAVLMMRKSPFWRGVGSQFAGWGAIDALIGWFGVRDSRKKAARPDAHTPEAQSKARGNLRRILAINTGLDVLYVTGGLWLSSREGRKNRFWQGAGLGIVVQGGFLFVFDLIHTLLLREEA